MQMPYELAFLQRLKLILHSLLILITSFYSSPSNAFYPVNLVIKKK